MKCLKVIVKLFLFDNKRCNPKIKIKIERVSYL